MKAQTIPYSGYLKKKSEYLKNDKGLEPNLLPSDEQNRYFK